MNDYLDKLNLGEQNPVIAEILAQANQLGTPIIKADALALIIQLIRIKAAKNVLEIGSAIGYSAIMMALNSECEVTTIERDEPSYRLAETNVSKAGLDGKVHLVLADALEYELPEDYRCDLLFIDAAKGQYRAFFEKYTPRLNCGGIVVCDNLLFHGLVSNPELCKTKNQAKIAGKIAEFNNYLLSLNDFDTKVYELGDGISISIKKR